MRLLLATIAVFSFPPLALAEGELDGLWKLSPIILSDGTVIDPYECSNGGADGTVTIEGQTYRDAEGTCTLSAPVSVRRMDATLFDVTCRGEWGSRTQRELLMLYRDLNDRERLLMVKPNGAADFERCN